MVSYKSIKKVAAPGISNSNEHAINIYKDEKFVVSYRYPNWTKEAVNEELYILRSRFPDYRGFTVEIG